MRLRPIAASDIDQLVTLDADPEVMRYVSDGVPNPRSVYEEGLLARMLAWPGQPFGFFAAHERDARAGADPLGDFLGWFHLRPSVADASMLELGYRLRRSAWGRGLATEGSRELLRHAFFELGQSEVDACADPRNGASIAVMKKCGMTWVGEFVHPRAPILVARYLVTRDGFVDAGGCEPARDCEQ